MKVFGNKLCFASSANNDKIINTSVLSVYYLYIFMLAGYDTKHEGGAKMREGDPHLKGYESSHIELQRKVR